MATLRGGLRDRMVFESVMNAIIADLTAEGWFDAGRWHSDITVVDEFPSEQDQVDLNTLAFTFQDATSSDMEMGSKATEHYISIFLDFFAENDAVGRHLIGDVFAYIRENMQFDVYDYRQATPPVEFVASVEGEVDQRKPTRAVNAWQKHWYVLAFRVKDDRTNE